MIGWLFKIVLGIIVGVVVLWWWLFFGSRTHCPECGVNLQETIGEAGVTFKRVRTVCACGWRAR